MVTPSQQVSLATNWTADIPAFVSGPPLQSPSIVNFLQAPVFSSQEREVLLNHARSVAQAARGNSRIISAEKIMAIYKLSTAEGRMILELAEALLRIPDDTTRDLLIFDKLAPGHWLAGDATGFVRGMESALELASGIVRSKYSQGLKAMLSKVGVPTVRKAIETAMRQMGSQFVFAENINGAIKKSIDQNMLFSFDMLGEAARSTADCDHYFDAYLNAIKKTGEAAKNKRVNQNSGVSIKLSALSCKLLPRYWSENREKTIDLALTLAIEARRKNIPITIDAEEFSRLAPTLDVFKSLLLHQDLRNWEGLGLVVQAYSHHAEALIDWLETLAHKRKTKISVRLVKGAYWDTEIKSAQEKGLKGFPVFTQKFETDLAYLSLAEKLMTASQYLYPQFASHNAYTLCAVNKIADRMMSAPYELQKLHGMGDAVHQELRKTCRAPLRIYAPVGKHHDLLAYLVRRVIENGASSSFMNQLADQSIAIETLVTDPYESFPNVRSTIISGDQLFMPDRVNSRGFDIDNLDTIRDFEKSTSIKRLSSKPVESNRQQIINAFDQAECSIWKEFKIFERAAVLDQIATELERASERIYQTLTHEAGKTISDAAGELREAVDFCRYYALQTRTLNPASRARGTVVAISPWNFPLAIFVGQIVAALGAGNTVLAKPAEQTPRIARLALSLMHRAGLPESALHLLFGRGETVGNALSAMGRADMIVFTGSDQTAKHIESAIGRSLKPSAPLIAETGGLNAMIVDSSALLERAVDDILVSAFQSAGQRCSALRMLYIQEDIADRATQMICEAAAELKVGPPNGTDTDIGPVIDVQAKRAIDRYVLSAKVDQRLIWAGVTPKGCFCPPVIIRVDGIDNLEKEVFGPVLHLATFRSGQEESIVNAINQSGFGLTFGLHSRIDRKIKKVSSAINAGNIYINRNQIGAIVGSQPFGGEGRSGTGPKAGGPRYLPAFLTQSAAGSTLPAGEIEATLTGPTGELNTYSTQPRGHILVLHPDSSTRRELAQIAKQSGNTVTESPVLPPERAENFDAVMTQLDDDRVFSSLTALRTQPGQKIIPVITDQGGYIWLKKEKHICRDTTASGGNVDLLMS